MKTVSRLIAAPILVLAVVFFGLQITSRAADTPITDAQVTAIKAHCIQIQATLSQLQQSDTLLRYNVGASYRTMSEKLMIPLNQRIAATEFDGSTLVRVTANYNKAYQKFYQAYQDYSDSLQATMEIDCRNKAEAFYDSIAASRQKRLELSKANTSLIALLHEYKKEFNKFRKNQVNEEVE